MSDTTNRSVLPQNHVQHDVAPHSGSTITSLVSAVERAEQGAAAKTGESSLSPRFDPEMCRCSDDLCLNFRNIHEVFRCAASNAPFCEFCQSVHVYGVTYKKMVGPDKGKWIRVPGCKWCQERLIDTIRSQQ